MLKLSVSKCNSIINRELLKCPCHRANGYRTLLAAFIFNAKYGDPPLSGWLANITVLYLSTSFCFEKFRSLPQNWQREKLLYRNDKGGFSTTHFWFKSSFRR